MDTEQKVTALSYILVVMLVGLFSYIGIDITMEFLSSNDSVSILTVNSGFGKISLTEYSQKSGFDYSQYNTYVDEQLNFRIEKPDTWQFDKNLDDILEKSGGKLSANGFLGGIYVTNNNEKMILVTVFDLSEQKDFSLDRYISLQEELMGSRYTTTVPIRFISENNDWALMGMQISYKNKISYGEQLLHYHDGILYMLQYQGETPQNIDKNKHEEIRSIMDSFEAI